MRIATSMIHASALAAMSQDQANLSKTQNQLSTGLKLQKPSDDPVAAVQVMQLQQQQSALTQYGTNIGMAKSRLQTSEQAMSDSESIVQQVSQLAIQANSSTLSNSDRQAIASQLTQLNQQLLSIANTKDSNGEYLFSGYAAGTQPFAVNGSGTVVYSGDQSARNIQIGATQYMADGNSGQQVFMSAPEGNSVYALAGNAANTGTGVITGTVQNRAAWVPDNYTLSFTSGTTWQVTDSQSNVVGGGTYTSGSAINFNGVAVTVTGTPATGDTFAISQSHTQDVFSTINSLVSALKGSISTPAQQAQFSNSINTVEAQLSQTESHFLSIQSDIGQRLSTLQTVDTTRQNTSNQQTTMLSGLQNVDFAAAASQLTQQQTSLQAAQQSYAKIAQLSLFSYL